MKNLYGFNELHAPHKGYFVHGFDSALNSGECTIGYIQGQYGNMKAAVHELATDEDDWHVVSLKNAQGQYDSFAVLGAADEEHAQALAVAYCGRLFDAAVVECHTSSMAGLQRYMALPQFAAKSQVQGWKLEELQDVLTSQPAMWDEAKLVSHNAQVSNLLLDMQLNDDNCQLLEKFDGQAALLEQLNVEVADFDSIVTTLKNLEKMTATLHDAMNRAADAGGVTVTNAEISKPFKRQGVTQIAISYDLSDGQTVTIFMHHPTLSAAMLKETDELISWKIVLNKRDVSGAVHPNQGQTLDAQGGAAYLRQLAARIIQLAQKNSARFTRTQAKNDEQAQAVADAQARLDGKIAARDSLKNEIADLNGRIDAVGQSAKRQKIIVKPKSNIGIDDNTLSQQAKDLISKDAKRTASSINAMNKKIDMAEDLQTKLAYQKQLKKLQSVLHQQRLNVFNAEDAIDAYFNDGVAFEDENLVELFPQVKAFIDASGEATAVKPETQADGKDDQVKSNLDKINSITAEATQLAESYGYNVSVTGGDELDPSYITCTVTSTFTTAKKQHDYMMEFIFNIWGKNLVFGGSIKQKRNPNEEYTAFTFGKDIIDLINTMERLKNNTFRKEGFPGNAVASGSQVSEQADGNEDEQPIILTGKELGDFPDTPEGKKQLREAAIAAISALKGEWIDCPALNGLEGDNVKVEIRQRGINEFKAFSGDPRKLKLAAKIEAIIRTAKMPKTGAWQDNQKKSSKRSVAGYYHLTNAVNIDGEKLNITVLIEKDNNGLLHYDLILPKDNAKFDSLEIKMSGRPIPDNYSGGDPDLLITPYDENIVNGFDAANGEKYVLNLFVYDADGNEIWADDDVQDDAAQYSSDNPYAAYANDDADAKKNADDWEARKPLTEKALEAFNQQAEQHGFVTFIESRHANLGRFQAEKSAGNKTARIDGEFKNSGGTSVYDAARDFTLTKELDGEAVNYAYSNDLGELLKQADTWLNEAQADSYGVGVVKISEAFDFIKKNLLKGDTSNVIYYAKKQENGTISFVKVMKLTNANTKKYFNQAKSEGYTLIDYYKLPSENMGGSKTNANSNAAHFLEKLGYSIDRDDRSNHMAMPKYPMPEIGKSYVVWNGGIGEYVGILNSGTGEKEAILGFKVENNISQITSSAYDKGKAQGIFNEVEQPESADQPEPAETPMNEQQNQSHPDYSQDDIDYLKAAINGEVDFSQADEVEKRFEAISERLDSPEKEALFEKAADAFAEYAISLEV